VTEGIVQVTAGGGRKPVTLTLARGNMVRGVRGAVPDAIGKIGFADYPGWTQGKILFSGTSVDAVCKEIEDRFDVRIHIADSTLRSMTITGILEGRDGRSALSTLCLLTGRNQRYENGVFVLF